MASGKGKEILMAFLPQGGPAMMDAALAVKTLRVIVAALAGGVVAFALVIEFAFRHKPVGGTLPDDVLLMVGGGLLTAGVVGSVVLPQAVLGQAIARLRGKSKEDVERGMIRTYQTACLLRAALLEGPGLFGVIVVLMTGNAVGYVAPGVAIVLMMLTLPSRAALNLLVERAMGRSVVLP
jgi:hypothetical protein